MGSSFKGICHATQADASMAFCQSLTSSTLSTDGVLTSSNCLSVIEGQANFSVTQSGMTTARQIAIPTFVDCSHSGGVNLSSEYFAIGLGMLATIWSAKRLISIFTGRTDPA